SRAPAGRMRCQDVQGRDPGGDCGGSDRGAGTEGARSTDRAPSMPFPPRAGDAAPAQPSVPLPGAATSAAVGKDACAPSFVTVVAPTRAAYAAASARDSPRPSRQASAAVNASPAPVVSTASTFTDGIRV